MRESETQYFQHMRDALSALLVYLISSSKGVTSKFQNSKVPNSSKNFL
jgi:hypothetical protein